MPDADSLPGAARVRAIRWCAALVLAAGLFAHANGVTGEFVGFNAVRALRDNPDIATLWPPYRALGLHLTGIAALGDGGTLVRRPVLHLSFALTHALPGEDAARHQAVNVLIHLSAALLLFGLVRRTLSLPRLAERWGDTATTTAAAVALLWVVHPLHTESVAYVIQRAESLAGFFALATLYAVSRSATAPQRRSWPLLTVLFCLLALGTKESAAALPIIVWLYEGLLVRGSLRAALRERPLLYATLIATWMLPAWLILRTWQDVMIDFREGRTIPYWLAQPRVLLEYVRLTFWPHPLHLYTNTQRFTEIGFFGILIGGGLLMAVLLRTVHGIARVHPAAFPAAAFLLLLAPTSLIATNDVIHEHRTYLASAALLFGAVAILDGWLRQAAPAIRPAAAMLGVCALLALPLALVAQQRNRDYADEFAAYYPADLAMAHGAIARHAAAQGRLDEALRRYEAMLALPEEAFGSGPLPRRFHRGRLHNDLGALYASFGRMAEASEEFSRAQRADVAFPACENNAAVLAAHAGDFEAARRVLSSLVASSTWSAIVLNNLGATLAASGDIDGAHNAFTRAIGILPNLEITQKNRQALSGRFELRVLVIRNYDDPWLQLQLTPAG